MSGELTPMELLCPSCAHVERCDCAQRLARLQQAGSLRRTKDPEPDVVLELFVAAADRFRCAECGHVGLTAREACFDDWDDWDAVRNCEICKKVIPRERVEVFPHAKLCAVCQQKDEVRAADEVEYCPRCGGVMTTKLVRQGTSRYVMSCPSCGVQT